MKSDGFKFSEGFFFSGGLFESLHLVLDSYEGRSCFALTWVVWGRASLSRARRRSFGMGFFHPPAKPGGAELEGGMR